MNEPEKGVRNAIAQIIGVLVKHEFAKKDAWCNEVLRIIFDYTRSDDAHKSEVSFAETLNKMFVIYSLQNYSLSILARFISIRNPYRIITRSISTSHGTTL